MKQTRKEALGMYYFPRVKSFHIVVRIKDVPGALGSVLKLLRDHINLAGSTAYNVEGGGAILSAFGRSLSKSETEGKLERLLKRLPMVLECEVKGSDQGLLLDSFHSGLEVAPDRPAVAFPLAGISRIYDHLAEILGSAGETILFEEGSALGTSTGQYLNARLGRGTLEWRVKALMGMYGMEGWGSASLEVERPNARFSVKVRDCFECVEAKRVRKGCDFLRGHLASTVSALSGGEFKCEETKCRLLGDPTCDFVLSRQEA